MVKDVVAVVTETQCAPAPASDCAILVGAKNRRLRVQFRAVARRAPVCAELDGALSLLSIC